MQFLLIPPLSVVAAVAWNAWRSRPRKELTPEESVAHFRDRMRALAPANPFHHRRSSTHVGE